MRNSITFIIACYNDPAISKTLESIIRHAEPNDQILVMDGNSQDETPKIANEILKGFVNSTLVSEPDSGLYDAWNKGIKLAKSEWVAFLGCGDYICDNYRSRLTEVIEEADQRLNFIHFKTKVYVEENNSQKILNTLGGKLIKPKFRIRMGVAHVGALHNRSLFTDTPYSTEFKCVSDYEFLLKKLDDLNPYFIDKVLTMMEGNGISSRYVFTFREELTMKRKLGGYSTMMLRYRFVKSIILSSIHRLIYRVL